MWRRLLGWFATQKALRAIAERECRHDRSEPMCQDCERRYTVW